MTDNEILNTKTEQYLFTVTIDNSEPIELIDFVKMFTSIGANYSRFIKKNYPSLSDNAKICIKEVRKGSIIADLLPVVTESLISASQTADVLNSLIDFMKHISGAFLCLLPAKNGSDNFVSLPYQKSELLELKDMIQVIAKDKNGKGEFKIHKGDIKIEAKIEFDTPESKLISATIDKHLKIIERQNNHHYERVLMVFTRTETNITGLDKKTGDKVRIEEICKKDLAVYYDSDLARERLKYEIAQADEIVYQKGFIVDVSVKTRNDKPVAYAIMNFHEVIELPSED